MGILYLKNSDSGSLKKEFRSRNNPIDTWVDILNYSSNLHGNWLLSKHIFYTCIVPTAERNPALFARWIKEIVQKSGVKLKSQSEFIDAINILSNLNGRTDSSKIKKALYYLFDSGLQEPGCVETALNNISA